MKKKIVSLVVVVALAFTALVGTTLAYFTDNDDNAKNTFTVGNVEIKLEEPSWDSTGAEDAPEVYPGEALAKDPTVTNIGANPCFVRVKVEGLDVLGEDNLIKVRTNYVVDALGEKWVLHTDGYYYYVGVLAKDAVTTPVFDSIVIPTTLTNDVGPNGPEFAGSYDIDVSAQAVQAQGAKPSFTAVEAMTVAEIAAWFATCGL